METLESSRVCRLCGKHSGISIDIFDKNENHLKKINAVLPIMVHEMDLLPKHMCHRCSYKLEEFFKFYVDCLKTDSHLKSQLSWMGKEVPQVRVGTPMVQIENIKIETPDYDAATVDMTPLVGDVNYMNSMNTMAFEPDDISYGAYRCRCCCDKMDQSNPTVSTNYSNTAESRCSRLENDVDSGSDSRTIKISSSSTSKLDMFQEQSSVLTQVNKNDDVPKNAGYSLCHIENVKSMADVNEDVKSVITRNLRPRNLLVNYVGQKRKSPSLRSLSGNRKSKIRAKQQKLETTQMKVERYDDFEGRILRPRNVTIDYRGQRKYSKSSNKNQRLNGAELNVNKRKVRNIANQLKLPPEQMLTAIEDRINFAVKQEQLADLEDSMLNESILSLPKNRTNNNFADRINVLLNNIKVQNDRVNCSLLSRTPSDFSGVDGMKCLRSTNRRVAATHYASKYLRSHDLYLRNGKRRKLNEPDVVASTFVRNRHSLMDSKLNIRNLKKAFRGFIDVDNISASTKLPYKNASHYCEECHTSFVSKELFKLHLCYH
ncbi:uncharacterized protein LOC117226199 [Megalopta genalis]|uniref:uncharacterized protein LOC117226199 n=1 Tax=Megalopta genalis TaxID=115081 RepID=UPI003FD1EBB5